MSLARRNRTAFDIWPGFVDALSTLLMVIIFVLLIFVIAQFSLTQALSGSEQQLDRLNRQIGELAELLSLERRANTDLRSNVEQLSTELQSTLAKRDELAAEASSLRDLRDVMTNRLAAAQQQADRTKGQLGKVSGELEDAYKTIDADREKIEAQLKDLAALRDDITAMQALKEDLEKDLKGARLESGTRGEALAKEREISAAAKAQLALFNRQIAALREQLAQLNAALEVSERKDVEQKAQIADLGKRLNTALAGKVQELARYRSEFFGRLREVLGDRSDIQIVGDRFVFQSEVLFDSGSAEIGENGKEKLAQFANTLKEIAAKIPDDIKWILRVDGHTDDVPIATSRFPSNWELSTARAISVVKFLVEQGIPPDRLVAAGFGEFQPLDTRDDEIARRRNRRIEMKLDQR